MNLDTAALITRSGLLSHAEAVTVRATNIANAETTETPEGGPFRPLAVALATRRVGDEGVGVETEIDESGATPMRRHEPGHPHADEQGWVAYPDVDLNVEITSLAIARRSYEANLAAASTLRAMGRAALDLAR
ncbi:MAG: flagellar basal body rod C-terminal domain-containing protein [Acidobacteriota bacterium]